MLYTDISNIDSGKEYLLDSGRIIQQILLNESYIYNDDSDDNENDNYDIEAREIELNRMDINELILILEAVYYEAMGKAEAERLDVDPYDYCIDH